MGKIEIDWLVTTVFSHCPFCLGESSMKFEWGYSIPKQMTCSGCGAKWELLFGFDKGWAFLGAKLTDTGSTKKGIKLLGRLYDRKFWEKTVLQEQPEKAISLKKVPVSHIAEKIVIIKEIIKIRCPYCGGLYDEVKDRCPYCGGKR